MEDMTEIRHAMYQRGFSILPISGKRPPMDEWQKLCANSDAIALWPRLYPFAGNTGVHTRDTPAIDADIFNEEAAEAIEALARARFEEHGTFAVRVGLAPKRAFLFRADKPFHKLALKLVAPNGKGEKIEILGDGEQLVCHGVHPDTRKPYAWTGGTPWADIYAKDLPLLTEKLALEFLRDAAELLATEYGYTIKSAPWTTKTTNGDAGKPHQSTDWGELFSDIYTGADLHDAIARLAFSFVATGMSGAAAVARLRSMMEKSQAPRDARWQDRYDDIPRAVRSAQEKLEVSREQEFMREQAERLERAAQAEQAPQPEPPPKPQPNILPFHRHGEVDPLEARTWCVHELIPETGSGLFAGRPSTRSSSRTA